MFICFFSVCLRIDQLWMCMECKQILCGHIALGHTTAHFTFLKKHCLYINIESAAIYWYVLRNVCYLVMFWSLDVFQKKHLYCLKYYLSKIFKLKTMFFFK